MIEPGIWPISQYTIIFILGINPFIFKIFKPKHFVIYGIGVLASFLNHRAIFPFLLICLADLDYSALDAREKKRIILFFIFQVTMLMLFAGGA